METEQRRKQKKVMHLVGFKIDHNLCLDRIFCDKICNNYITKLYLVK